MTAYYNEIDPYAAQWLRNLIKQGVIAPGVVDERSIEDIKPYELRQYTQCHFFAGIGVWSHALRLAGWPDERPVWTGSCPCQPFSAAGKGAGFADERHLWPAFHHLIRECRPPVVFGEQVASRDGLEWLDLVQADLEGSGYATGASDLCAAGVGAPHIRQRLYFVADAKCRASEQYGYEMGTETQGMQGKAWEQRIRANLGHGSDVGELADPQYHKQRGGRGTGRKGQEGHESRVEPSRCGTPCELGNAQHSRLEGHACTTNGHWGHADWLLCRDGKWRPVEPGTFPLAHGAASRVGRLRAYGNAIVPQVAAAMIGAYMDVRNTQE